jgi:hypothetical protein
MQQLEQIDHLERGIILLASQIKKESQLNEKVQLNIKIQERRNEIKDIKLLLNEH